MRLQLRMSAEVAVIYTTRLKGLLPDPLQMPRGLEGLSDWAGGAPTASGLPRASNPREREQGSSHSLQRLSWLDLIQTITCTSFCCYPDQHPDNVVGDYQGPECQESWGSPWGCFQFTWYCLSVITEQSPAFPAVPGDPGRSDWVIGQTQDHMPWDRSGSEEAGLDLSQQVRERGSAIWTGKEEDVPGRQKLSVQEYDIFMSSYWMLL